MLLAHQLQLRRDAVEHEERRILFVARAPRIRGFHHRYFAETLDALGAPAFVPDALQLVEIRNFGVIAVILRTAPPCRRGSPERVGDAGLIGVVLAASASAGLFCAVIRSVPLYAIWLITAGGVAPAERQCLLTAR